MSDLLPSDIKKIFRKGNIEACKLYINGKCPLGKLCDDKGWKQGGQCKYRVETYRYNECENAYLLFNRFLSADDEISSSDPNRKNGKYKTNSYLSSFHQIVKKNNMKIPIQESILKAKNVIDFAVEQKEAIEIMQNMKIIKCEKVETEQIWNMIIGLGSNTVSEVGMTLHFVNGVPYIPGQAIKGCFRHYYVNEFFCGDEKKALLDETFILIFGNVEENTNNGDSSVGNIIFFDAYPNNEPTIVKDIMTNHNQKYYQNKGELCDGEALNPIQFLCIDKTFFTFNIAVKRLLSGKNNDITTSDKLLDSVVKSFKKMLESSGFGAKTSVGYGYVRELNNPQEKNFKEK